MKCSSDINRLLNVNEISDEDRLLTKCIISQIPAFSL